MPKNQNKSQDKVGKPGHFLAADEITALLEIDNQMVLQSYDLGDLNFLDDQLREESQARLEKLKIHSGNVCIVAADRHKIDSMTNAGESYLKLRKFCKKNKIKTPELVNVAETHGNNHWKLMEFKKEKSEVQMTTIDSMWESRADSKEKQKEVESRQRKKHQKLQPRFEKLGLKLVGNHPQIIHTGQQLNDMLRRDQGGELRIYPSTCGAYVVRNIKLRTQGVVAENLHQHGIPEETLRKELRVELKEVQQSIDPTSTSVSTSMSESTTQTTDPGEVSSSSESEKKSAELTEIEQLIAAKIASNPKMQKRIDAASSTYADKQAFILTDKELAGLQEESRRPRRLTRSKAVTSGLVPSKYSRYSSEALKKGLEEARREDKKEVLAKASTPQIGSSQGRS